jgi:hypothetical protein
VRLRADVKRFQRSKTLLGDQQRRRQEDFVNGDIGPFGMLDIPTVRCRITAINKFKTIPFKYETYRSIDRVDGWEAANYDSVLVEDDLIGLA